MTKNNIKYYIDLELIILMSFFAQFFYSFPMLKSLQTLFEFAILGFLLIKALYYKYTYIEILLVLSFFFFSILSFCINSFDVFLVNFKNTGIGIFSLLYFLKHKFKSRLISYIFIISVVMILLNKFIPGCFSFVSHYTRFSNFNEHRFGGIFFNTHFNGCFIGLYILSYHFNFIIFIISLIIMYFTGSKYNLFAYFMQIILLPLIALFKKHKILFLTILCVFIYFFIQYLIELIFNFFNNEKLVSFAQIFLQLLDLNNYKTFLLRIIPGDYLNDMYNISISSKHAVDLLFNSGTNEVGIFTFFYQAGTITAILYIWILLKNIDKKKKLFIVITFMHYLFITNPLILYLCMSEFKFSKNKLKKIFKVW